MNASRKTIIIIAIALVLIFVLVGIAKIEIDRSLVRKKITLVKMDLQNLDNALEAYAMDANLYPVPDVDLEGNYVIPHVLTSIVTSNGIFGPWITKLPYDPFNHHGKGLYHYAPDKDHGSFWGITNAFIISSFGPDEVSGYGTMKFNLEHFVYDSDQQNPGADKDSIAPFRLKTSPFTYDPTNGLISGGDIWHRGP